MRHLLPLLALSALFVGCPGTGDPAVQQTDSWTVTLSSVESSTGWADLTLDVIDLDGESAPGLTLVADVSMPAMGHGSTEPVTSEELGDGSYGVRVYFQMAGEWVLEGSLDGGDGPESFVHTLDVVSE